MRLRPWISRLFARLSEAEVVDLSAALSFYMALSIAPLVIVIVTFVGQLGSGLEQSLLTQIRNLIGPQTAEVTAMIIQNVSDRPDLGKLAGWFAFITIGLSAGVVFAHLQYSLNRIFRTRHAPTQKTTFWQDVLSLVRKRLLSFGLVLSFILISLVSLIISSLIALFIEGITTSAARAIEMLMTLSTYTLLFTVIFKWIPDHRKEASWRIMARGGLITAILFAVGKYLIGLYLGQSALNSAYGAAGSFFVFLVWVYYSSIIIFFGATLCALQSNAKSAGVSR